MVASVPDETARSFSIEGKASTTASAKRTSSSVGAPNVVPEPITSCTASSTSGWAWPRMSGPHDPTMSM